MGLKEMMPCFKKKGRAMNYDRPLPKSVSSLSVSVFSGNVLSPRGREAASMGIMSPKVAESRAIALGRKARNLLYGMNGCERDVFTAFDMFSESAELAPIGKILLAKYWYLGRGQDHKAARDTVMPLFEETGSVAAMTIIGRSYLPDPVTYESDMEKAEKYLRDATFKHSAEAARALTELYERKGDLSEAKKYRKIALNLFLDLAEADLNEPEMVYNVGWCLLKENSAKSEASGEEDDDSIHGDPIEWLERSAQLGWPPAIVSLSLQLGKERERRKDAIEWLKRGAAQEDPDCIFCLALAYLGKLESVKNFNLKLDRTRGRMLLNRVKDEKHGDPRYHEVLVEQGLIGDSTESGDSSGSTSFHSGSGSEGGATGNDSTAYVSEKSNESNSEIYS